MQSKEFIIAPKTDAIIPFGVVDETSVGGALYFMEMKKGQGLSGIKNPMYKHGMDKTKLYWVWIGMRQRTNNPNNKGYKYYGERGIKVCQNWNDPLIFKKWAIKNGYKEGLVIDRINNNKGYKPKNCRWITIQESNRNKRRSEDYGLCQTKYGYAIHIRRNGHTYYGGHSSDILIAKKMRDKLISELKNLP